MPALLVALPLLAAAVLAGTSALLHRRAADLLAIATAAATTALAVALVVRTGDGRVVYWFGGWEPRGDVAVGVTFAVDRAGAALTATAGVLTTAALVFSWRWLDAAGTLFHALMLVFLAALTGFTLSGDLFNMFVFFELVGVAAYALTGFRHEEPGPIQGALNFAVTNSLGGILILFGVGLLYGRTGALNLAQIGQTLAAAPPDGLVVTAFALLVAGLFVKAAVVPFHFWLADAYAVAPTPVCVLLAGITSELGLYAMVRVYWTVFATAGMDAAALRGVLLTAGVLTALLGGVMCFVQDHLPRLLAFATVSHAGITLMGLALLDADGLGGALLYLVSDGLVKAGLFIGVGVILHRLGTVDVRHLHGRGRRQWVTAGLLVAGAAGLAGLPPSGTWLAKAVMEEAAVARGLPWVTWVFVAASALTAGAVVHAAGRVFAGLGPPPGARADVAPPAAEASTGATRSHVAQSLPSTGNPSPGYPAHNDPSARPSSGDLGAEEEPEVQLSRQRTPAVLVAPGVALLLGAFALGIVPGAAGFAHEAAVDLRDTAGYTAAVLDGDIRPVAEPAHHTVPKHPVTAVATGLLTAGLAAALGLGARRLRPAPHPAAPWRQLRGVMAAVRLAHSGQAGDSVTWLTVGAATLGVLFAVLLR